MNQSSHDSQVSSPLSGRKWTQLWRTPGSWLLVCGGVALLSYARSGVLTPIGWDLVALFGVALLIPMLANTFKNTVPYAEAVSDGPAWVKTVAALWLYVCALGPFVGIALAATTLWPPTPSSWHGQYEARVLLNIALPIGLAAPLGIALASSRARWVAVPVVLCVTALPVASAWNSMRDLRAGDRWVRQKRDCTARSTDDPCTLWVHALLLPHTRCVLLSVPEGTPVVPEGISVVQALKSENLDYEVTSKGNYSVTLKFTNGRSQQTFIEAKTKTYQGAEWRKVYSESFSLPGPLSQTQAADLLADADDRVFGGWCTEQSGERTRVYYQTSVPQDASPADLHHAVSLVSAAADEMEKKVMDTDTY